MPDSSQRRRLSRSFRNQLHIVGSGEAAYEREIQALAKRLSVEKDVIFEGFRTDALEALAAADDCLVCSRREAFGRVAIEAMLVGTPVVATDSGGIPEIIEDGVSGMLYLPGDATMLAGKILELVGDPELYRNLSQNALESVYRRFTRSRYVQQIKEVISEVLREAAARRE